MAAIGIKLIAISIAINNREFKHDLLVSRDFWFPVYDFIVVGAGTAGSVVAAKLADDITKTVLLLEAGEAQKSSSDVPALRPTLIGTEIDWNYELVPQKYAYFALKDSQMPIPAGRVFGGSSTLSHLNYYRESPEYFEQWDKLYGIKNWTYADVVPFFLKSENNLDSVLVQFNDSYHMRGGAITVSTANPDVLLRQYMMSAERDFGFSETSPDGKQPFGVTVMQRMINKDGAALSTSTAYLEAKMRPNLHSFGNSIVTKLLIDNKNNQTIGVKFQKEGSDWIVKARKEVIVCAGPIGSPQLLMLSGIGPKKELEEMDIPVISDLKVGKNMKHSVSVVLDYNIIDQKLVDKPEASTESEYEYYNERAGPLAYIASAVHCFNDTKEEITGLSNGCVLPHIGFLDIQSNKLIERVNLKTEWNEYYGPYLSHSVFKLKAILRRPKSTGSLSLDSDNSFVKPLIDPKVFDEQSDVDDLVQTLNHSLNIFNSELMAELIEPFQSPIPGCKPCADDKYCEIYLRCIVHTVTDFLYVVGTCRMGSKKDEDSVVDEKFRVKGVTGLRVIDTSVLPIPTEQSVAIAVMLAERGVSFIEENYKPLIKLPEIKLNLTNAWNTNFWSNLSDPIQSIN